MKARYTRFSGAATIALAVVLPVLLLLNGTAEAQSANVQSVINGRNGANMTVQTQDMGDVVVVLNDYTSVEGVSVGWDRTFQLERSGALLKADAEVRSKRT